MPWDERSGGTISLRTRVDEQRSDAERDGFAPSRGTRRAVTVFLAAFFIAGLVGIELWPLTGWRLFSHVRRAEISSWHAVAVRQPGTEESLPFARLPQYRGTLHVVKRFEGLDPRAQTAVCRTWARAVRDLRGDGYEIRIYRVEAGRSINDRHDPRGIRRTLRFVCRDGAVESRGRA